MNEKETTPKIAMGGSGTAKASFEDASGGDVKIVSSSWSATGSVTVEGSSDDPTSAKITPTGVGPATVSITAATADGSMQASTHVTVIDKVGKPVSGIIVVTADAAPPKEKLEPADQVEPAVAMTNPAPKTKPTPAPASTPTTPAA